MRGRSSRIVSSSRESRSATHHPIQGSGTPPPARAAVAGKGGDARPLARAASFAPADAAALRRNTFGGKVRARRSFPLSALPFLRPCWARAIFKDFPKDAGRLARAVRSFRRGVYRGAEVIRNFPDSTCRAARGVRNSPNGACRAARSPRDFPNRAGRAARVVRSIPKGVGWSARLVRSFPSRGIWEGRGDGWALNHSKRL